MKKKKLSMEVDIGARVSQETEEKTIPEAKLLSQNKWNGLSVSGLILPHIGGFIFPHLNTPSPPPNICHFKAIFMHIIIENVCLPV